MKKILIILTIVIIYSLVFTIFIYLFGFSNNEVFLCSLSLPFLVFGILTIASPKIIDNKAGRLGRWLIKNSEFSDIHVIVNKKASKIYSIVFFTLSISLLLVPIVIYFIFQ